MRALSRLAILVLLLGAARVSFAAAPQAALELGRGAYEHGDYQGAIDTLRPLLYPTIELGNEEAVVEAHRLLALCYFFEKNEKLAEEEVSALLAMRPSYQLDPIVDPPVAVRFFQTVRQKQEERLRQIRERQLEEAQRAALEEAKKQAQVRARAKEIYVDRRVERHSRLIATIPFGVGQVQNGNRGLAIFLAVSEVLLGTASLSLFVAIDQNYPNGRFQHGQEGTVSALQISQQVTGWGFWATVAAGIIDAHVRYKPFVVIDQKDAPSRALTAPPPKVTLSPVLSPALIGIQGAF